MITYIHRANVVSHVIQFLLRRDTIQLYRQFLRVIMGIDDREYRIQLKRWIRSEFEAAITAQDDNDEVNNVKLIIDTSRELVLLTVPYSSIGL